MPNKPQKGRPCFGRVFFFVICRKVKRQSKLHSKRDKPLKDCRKRGFCHQLPLFTTNYHYLPPFATTPPTPRKSPPKSAQILANIRPKLRGCLLSAFSHPHAIILPNPLFALGRAQQRPSRPLCPRLIPRAALSTRSLGAICPRTHNLGRGSLARSAAPVRVRRSRRSSAPCASRFGFRRALRGCRSLGFFWSLVPRSLCRAALAFLGLVLAWGAVRENTPKAAPLLAVVVRWGEPRSHTTLRGFSPTRAA